MKKCKHCNIELNENIKHEGFQCKTCRNGLNRYGLDRNQQQNLLKAQDYKCSLCENSIELHVKNNQLGVIDHCHSTNKVRGILCGPCNTALGHIESVGLNTFLKNIKSYMPS